MQFYYFGDKSSNFTMKGVKRMWGFSNCHCEEDGRTTRQSIVFRESERGWRFAYWLTVDRHGLRPRDDKVGKDGFLIRKKDFAK